MAPEIREDVPLAPLTTFELGGPARWFATVADEAGVSAALAFAADRGAPVLFLGGGSNLVIADAGFPGLVVDLGGMRGLSFTEAGDEVEVAAMAGEPFDELVAAAVERNLAGLECLSGIPGLVGATPIQNVGAYGQEVSETVKRVRVLDRRDGTIADIGPEACAFAYRDSLFKRVPDRYVVLSVTFALSPGGAPALRYAELQRALVDEAPSLARVRAQVIMLRRRKSMVLDPADENRRSAGSFFTNPIVSDEEAQRVVDIALAAGIIDEPASMPRYPAGEGRMKLAAGWLIERAGIAKGHRRGQVRVSTRHALALTHLGGGRTEDLLALAREVRQTVDERFGVTLVPEPRLVGCAL